MLTRKLARASAKPLILSILAHGESYGYAILQRFERLSQRELSWDDSTLYPVLHHLENQGLLTSSWRQIAYDLAAGGGIVLVIRVL